MINNQIDLETFCKIKQGETKAFKLEKFLIEHTDCQKKKHF